MRNWQLIALGAVLAACGGKFESGDGAGGSGASAGTGGSAATGAYGGSGAYGGNGGSGAYAGNGGSGAMGGSGGMPNECQVPVTEPGPYGVTFRFVNASGAPLYVLEECRVRFDVTSCADGYVEPLSLYGDCTIDCAEANAGCIACGACAYWGVAVTGTEPREVQWSGNTYTFDMTADGCSCHNATAAPAGKYMLSVPVYDSEQAATAGDALYVVAVPFTLPAPGGVVEVQLAQLGM